MFSRTMITQLVCVAFVAAIMVPLGGAIFPYVAAALGRFEFQAAEALLSAALGCGLAAFIG